MAIGADVERLLGWFDAGVLVRPDATRPNTVALAQALMSLNGASEQTLDATAAHLRDAIGVHKHYVFVMCDGIGMNLIETLPSDAFLRRHCTGEMLAVFPSSTAPALTSLATGLWPTQHAVPTWWTHLPDAGVTMTILKFIERYSERPLEEFGIDVGQVYPREAMLGRATRDVIAFTPAQIADSTTTRYLYGGSAIEGYEHLSDATAAIADGIKSAASPTYTYLYIPYVDAAEHEHGVYSRQTRGSLEHVDAALDRLAVAIAGRARMIVTADHGLIDVPPRSRTVVTDRDPIMRHLSCPPAGEPRVPLFHVRSGQRDAFADTFRTRYGADWVLIDSDDAQALGLFGPEPFEQVARPRFGDFIALSDGCREMAHGADVPGLHGSHGGLMRGEMRIPLVLA